MGDPDALPVDDAMGLFCHLVGLDSDATAAFKDKQTGEAKAKPVCSPSTIKRSGRRKRRTKAEIEAICEAMFNLLEEEHPLTLRHVFYRMVSAGYVDKTESEYGSTVGRLLIKMRRDGRVPYDWLADNTRWQIKRHSYLSVMDALAAAADSYRRALWADSPVHVEVWTEKDAICSILYDVTDPWDVPLMAARGDSSDSFLWSTASQWQAIRKPVYVYYFGDHDPSGVNARRVHERKLREMAPDVKIHFVTVAVTAKQIEEFGLPTRPTKRNGNRAAWFKGDSVEVDAIPPHQL